MSPKMGRPKLDRPKNHDIKVRLDEDTHQKLLAYCAANGITKAEAIRRGIDMVLNTK